MTRVDYTNVAPGSLKAVYALEFVKRFTSTGSLIRPPSVRGGAAKDSLKTCRVTVDGEVGRVDVPLAHAVQSE
jgi:hypothetical protein